MPAKILLVDDDTAHRTMLKTLLRSWGYAITDASNGKDAVSAVKEQSFDCVLSDVRMGEMDGLTALFEIMRFNPAMPVILMTAYSSVETAVDALRGGAFDYLIKPLDFDALRASLERALSLFQGHIEQKALKQQLNETQKCGLILGKSQKMQEVMEVLETVAPTEATVLITGESGTGKELVAKALHGKSTRASRPFVVVNCAALADTLLESELFGHEKGAFTGAEKRREGRFVQADGGTLFLDEIGEMPLALQAKLLRALQQGEVQRLGQDKTLRVDVRVVAATNRNLEEEVSAGRFRQDLFFRLNVISIAVPPLRERRDDIPILAAYFLEKFATINKKDVKGFAPKAMDALLRYSWPGNVRELQNAIERAVILVKDPYITPNVLPLSLQTQAETDDSTSMLDDMTLEHIERLAITQMLKKTHDNKSETARRLGITRSTLHSKLKKYSLEDE
ncbi:MAG: sigma-54-dependent Fis family transcriptional regulator [Desulfovibrio sp.]|nr:sigma-54-dependent Fis family transcriptional regulator [Desulfovibrio sp.]